jgi:hypothetical protein
MKIECINCGRKEELNEKTFNFVSSAVKEYEMDKSGYINLLNNMFGKCLDSTTHSFEFDETFKEQIQKVVNKKEISLLEEDKLKNNIELLKQDLKINNEKINQLKLKTDELSSRINIDKDSLQKLIKEDEEITKELENLTGNSDINMWRMKIKETETVDEEIEIPKEF